MNSHLQPSVQSATAQSLRVANHGHTEMCAIDALCTRMRQVACAHSRARTACGGQQTIGNSGRLDYALSSTFMSGPSSWGVNFSREGFNWRFGGIQQGDP